MSFLPLSNSRGLVDAEADVRAQLKEISRQQAANGTPTAELVAKERELTLQLSLLERGDLASVGGRTPASSARSAATQEKGLPRTGSGRSLTGLQRALSSRRLGASKENLSFRRSQRDIFGATGASEPTRRYNLTEYEKHLCSSLAADAVGMARPAKVSCIDSGEAAGASESKAQPLFTAKKPPLVAQASAHSRGSTASAKVAPQTPDAESQRAKSASSRVAPSDAPQGSGKASGGGSRGCVVM